MTPPAPWALVQKNPGDESTLTLCRTLVNNTDQDYRKRVANLLVRRGVTAEKCMRLIASDNQMATGIAIAGAAAGIAAVRGSTSSP
jgi:hypothetical protein